VNKNVRHLKEGIGKESEARWTILVNVSESWPHSAVTKGGGESPLSPRANMSASDEDYQGLSHTQLELKCRILEIEKQTVVQQCELYRNLLFSRVPDPAREAATTEPVARGAGQVGRAPSPAPPSVPTTPIYRRPCGRAQASGRGRATAPGMTLTREPERLETRATGGSLSKYVCSLLWDRSIDLSHRNTFITIFFGFISGHQSV